MSEDHRTITGRQRSEAMRQRLIEAGASLIAGGGQAALTIDAVTQAASVARGSFYKHFKRPEELMEAIGLAKSEQIILQVNPHIAEEADAARRLAMGILMVLRLVEQDHRIGQFITRAGWPHLTEQHVFHTLVGKGIREGMASGRFAAMPESLAYNIVTGTIIGAMHTMTTSTTAADYKVQIAIAILCALGVGRDEAVALASG